MLQTLRHRLAFVLIILLPFHALLATVGTKVLTGSAQHPILILSLWKELLLSIILLCALLEILRDNACRRQALALDVLDQLILVAVLLSMGITYASDVSFKQALFGFRYDFVPLVSFFILRRVSWEKSFLASLKRWLLFIGLLLVGYGLIALVLPMSYFQILGYSDLHSLYDAHGALAPFQAIEGGSLRRMQSAMSGPNQLGTYLLISWSILLTMSRTQRKKEYYFFLLLIALGIFFTFSRAAWIASVVIFLSIAPRSKKYIVTFSGIVLSGIIVMALLFPQSLLRVGSTSDHLRKPVEALQILFKHPWGLGLGSAGPASNAVSDMCVELSAGADASWAVAHPQLCVFVDGVQVQPRDRACSCPRVTENWYLQWGVEFGVLGFLLSLAIAYSLLVRLYRTDAFLFAAVLGVSVIGLFLHVWEDVSVSLTVWLLLGMVYSQRSAPDRIEA